MFSKHASVYVMALAVIVILLIVRYAHFVLLCWLALLSSLALFLVSFGVAIGALPLTTSKVNTVYQIITTQFQIITIYAPSLMEAVKEAHDAGFTLISIVQLREE